MKLGERIKQLRAEQNLTQPGLAEKARIEQSYLSKLENGKGVPSFDIISRIADVFGLTGMELVNSLEHSYIEESLSHLPEVAAEYASVRARKEKQLKARFVIAGVLMVLGVGLFGAGQTAMFFNDGLYTYRSDGVILPGEHINHFSEYPIDGFETREELEARTLANRDRLDPVRKRIYQLYGSSFMEEVEGGQRRYSLVGSLEGVRRPENSGLKVLGAMAMLAGLFYLGFVIVFGIFRKP